MTTREGTRGKSLAELGISPEFVEQVRGIGQRNRDFYATHEQDLWKAHAGKWLLIHDGATVESFDEFSGLASRLDELEPLARAGAFHMRQTDNTWIL